MVNDDYKIISNNKVYKNCSTTKVKITSSTYIKNRERAFKYQVHKQKTYKSPKIIIKALNALRNTL